MCRFTRLPNAFTKKTKGHAEATAAYFMYHNLGRTIRRCGLHGLCGLPSRRSQ